jgi:DNA-binding response OmpR family regulator
MRVLLVEDHAELADTVATGLRREGMAVDVALDGNDALAHLALTDYDVLVLDRDLPGVHGDQICRSLVAERRAGRILMLTAAGSIEDRVDGLSLGADGRVVSAEELLARVWDENADPFTTTVKVTIRRLRAKLGEPPLIETVSHSGYRI